MLNLTITKLPSLETNRNIPCVEIKLMENENMQENLLLNERPTAISKFEFQHIEINKY